MPTKAVAVGVQGPSDWQLVLDQLVVVLGDDANQVEHCAIRHLHSVAFEELTELVADHREACSFEPTLVESFDARG